MNPATRQLARITIDPDDLLTTESLVETLMGKKSELRYEYIQEHAQFVDDVDV
jgi:topoisomerase-4 subunit B